MALLNKQTVLEHLYKRLIETANNNVGFECDAGIVFEEIATDRIKTWLDEVQTVDAEPIIRCKDCKYYDYGENPSETWSVCTAHINCYIETCADNFCSWAERKDIRTFTAEEWEFYKLV